MVFSEYHSRCCRHHHHHSAGFAHAFTFVYLLFLFSLTNTHNFTFNNAFAINSRVHDFTKLEKKNYLIIMQALIAKMYKWAKNGTDGGLTITK